MMISTNLKNTEKWFEEEDGGFPAAEIYLLLIFGSKSS